MIISTELDELTTAVQQILLQKSEPRIILIDGWTGAGKSSVISSYLSKEIGWNTLEADDKLIYQNTGNYLFDESAVKNTLPYAHQVIIDSILGLKLMKIANMKADITIYVKRVNKNGEWIHDYIVDPKANIEKILNYHESPLERELIQYHRSYLPHQTADIIYENYDPFNDYDSRLPQMFYD